MLKKVIKTGILFILLCMVPLTSFAGNGKDEAEEKKNQAEEKKKEVEDLIQELETEKANTEVARWAGYLTVKEDAFGVTFILAAKDLPSMDAIGKMDAKELVAVQEDIDSVRELYDALSDVAKADAEVARWIGYVDQKEEAAVEAAAAVAAVAVDSVKAINAKTIDKNQRMFYNENACGFHTVTKKFCVNSS